MLLGGALVESGDEVVYDDSSFIMYTDICIDHGPHRGRDPHGVLPRPSISAPWTVSRGAAASDIPQWPPRAFAPDS